MNHEKKQASCRYTGERVRITGQGRNWTWEYSNETGVVLGPDEYTRGYRVKLDSGEEVGFYSDEFDII